MVKRYIQVNTFNLIVLILFLQTTKVRRSAGAMSLPVTIGSLIVKECNHALSFGMDSDPELYIHCS